MICVIELNRNITAMPVRIIVAGVIFLNLDIATIIIVGTRENMNAFITVVLTPLTNGTRDIPRTMLRVAPRNAPDDMPMVYGSARGFLKSFCIIAPATARPAPIMIAPIARGVRVSQM